MITLFTTTKDFYGRNRVNQINAIKSWLSSRYNPEVIIFGNSAGIEELGSNPNLKILEQVKTSPTGAPFANLMFDVVSRIAHHDICCYINADILLTDKFFETLREINNKVTKKFLLVGARIDVAVDELMDFSAEWEKKFIDKYKTEFKLHPPSGSDFFIFPKGQYRLGNMQNLLIGRPGWDLWMIYNARKRKLKVIDISFSIMPYHQNHDYSHKPNPTIQLDKDEEAILNLSGIPSEYKFLFTLQACNYYYAKKRILKNFARNNFNQYEIIERVINADNLFLKIRLKKDKLLYKLSQNIFLKLLRSNPRKFNIGSGKFEFRDGWLYTDKNALDIANKNEWKIYLRFLKLNNIMAEHVWEHLNEKDTELANKNCFHFLKRGGVLRIAVPDGFSPDKNYIEHVRPGGRGAGADDHKILYNYKIMKERLEKVGFRVTLLEYWDENGKFHFANWVDEGGKIIRSRRYDSRNTDGKLAYTSLIVDAIKPTLVQRIFNA